MDIREKLVELANDVLRYLPWGEIQKDTAERIADRMMDHGVTVQECCHKDESVISKTGLMCTACYSDIDRDAVFCKCCGAKVMPQPPKGE